MKYFVYKDSQVLGPYSPEEMEQAGPLQADTLVCVETASGRRDSDWLTLADVTELSGLRVYSPALMLEEPLPGSEAGVLERFELDTMGVPPTDEDGGGDWLKDLFDDPDFKQRWLGILPNQEDEAKLLEDAKSQIASLTDRVSELQRRLQELEASGGLTARAAGPAPLELPPLPEISSAPADFAAAPAPAPVELPSLAPLTPQAAPQPLAAPAAAAEEPAKGLKLKISKTQAGLGLKVETKALKVVAPASAAAAPAGALPGLPAAPAAAPSLSPAASGPGLSLPAAGTAPVEPPSAAPVGGGLPGLPGLSAAPAPMPTLGTPAPTPTLSPTPAPAAAPAPAPVLAPPPPLAPAPSPFAALATPAPAPAEPSSLSAPPMNQTLAAPPMTMAFGAAPAPAAAPITSPPGAGLPSLDAPPIPSFGGSPTSPFTSATPTPAPTGETTPGPQTQDLLARLAKPSPKDTAPPQMGRRGPSKKVLAIVGVLIIGVVAGAFFFLLKSPKDLKNMMSMEPEQSQAANPFDAQSTPSQPQAPVTATTLQPSPPPPPQPEPAPAPAAVQDQGDAAINLVKGYPLDGDRGTVGAWLQYSFTSNPGDGAKEEWTAGGVDASTYLVQYRVLTAGGGAAGDGISYVFEVDVASKLVLGKNPPARQLLSGSSQPARPKRRAPGQGAGPVRKAARKRSTAAPAAPKVVPLLPLPADSDLLPPAEDDSTFRGDTVNPGQ